MNQTGKRLALCRSSRDRHWRCRSFFRPIGEALEVRNLLSSAPVVDGYGKVAPDWFFQVPGQFVTSSQTFIGPLAPASGNSGGGTWQATAEVAQWIVRLTSQATQEAGTASGADYLLDRDSINFDVLRGLGLPGQLLVAASSSTDATRTALATNPNVASFEPNAFVAAQAITPLNPDFPSQTSLNSNGQFGATVDADIDAPEAWDVNTGSSNVVAGVIDSGMDYTHPDLYLNVWINQGEIPAALKQVTPSLDVDQDGRITFYDLNAPADAPYVTDFNHNGYIDAGDLLADPRWTDGVDTDRNAFVDDLVGWNFRSAADEPYAKNDPQDVLGHGTHVAGTIGAIGSNATVNNNGQNVVGTVGVDWRTSLMPLKFLDSSNSGQTADAVAAINYATMMRQQYGEPVKVLNTSWGFAGTESQALRDAISAAGQSDILLVAAAGNGNVFGDGINLDQNPFFPASSDLSNVISVAASGPNDELARFSNYGATSVDLAAPGVGVLSTLPGGRYGTENGTSMAAPHVTGVAALIWSALPYVTSTEVRQAILTSVDTKDSSNNPLFTSGLLATSGRLNAYAAINSKVFAPRVSLLKPAGHENEPLIVTSTANNYYDVTVDYYDRQGMDDTTIGQSTVNNTTLYDVIATRQWGAADTIVGQLQGTPTISPDKTDIKAVYRFTAPGGSWDPLDFGGYSLSVVAGQVLNKNGVSVPTDPFGNFSVKIADPTVYYVDSTSDGADTSVGDGICASSAADGKCTLRAAVQEANAAQPSHRTIILDAGTFRLSIAPVMESTVTFPVPVVASGCFTTDNSFTSSDIRSGDLDVFGTVTLMGNLSQSTLIDGGGIDRIFKVYPGATLSLNRVTVDGGAAPYGGGILSAGNLQMNLTTISSNSANAGGGIAVWGGEADINTTTLDQNSASRGGGLLVCNAAIANVTSSTISNNVAVSTGGGVISSGGGPVQMTNTTVSSNSGGAVIGNVMGDNSSFRPAISANGNVIAFRSNATNLVPGDANGVEDLFLYKRQTRQIEIIGNAVLGGSGGSNPSISGDGTFVTFSSFNPALAPSDTDTLSDVYLFDDQNGTIERITASSSNVIGSSSAPSISSDGNFITYMSDATNLVPGDTNGSRDIFVYDRQTKSTERVSVASDGTQANGNSSDPAISSDGRFISFTSSATNLVPGDSNGVDDIFVFNRLTKVTERVSISSMGDQGNGLSKASSISADGRFVAFGSSAFNLVSGDTNGVPDVFVFDRQSGTVERESLSTAGAQGNGDSTIVAPNISGDGQIVTFCSSATNLVPGDTNARFDTFVVDRQAHTIERSSVADDGSQGSGNSEYGSLSFDGKLLAFASTSRTIDSGFFDNGYDDLFVVDRPNKHLQSLTIGVGGAVTFENVSVVDNQGVPNISGQIVAHNSLFARNTPRIGDFISNYRNVLDSSPTNALNSLDFIVADARVGPLQDNGGPTKTNALLPGSPAIEAAIGGSSTTVDQRGISRPQDGDGNYSAVADAGAFEAYYAEIDGTVFRDLDGDGVRDAGEPGLDSQAVYLDLNENGVQDSDEASLSTSQGNFSISSLTPSSYWITPRPAPGWSLTKVSSISRASVSTAAAQGNFDSTTPSISADGRYVAFRSVATNLVSGDTNNYSDIFLYDRQNRTTIRVSEGLGGIQANGDSYAPSISADGRFIAFQSNATNIGDSVDVDGASDILVYDRNTKQIHRLRGNGSAEPNGASTFPAISADGRFVAFWSSASNLVTSDTNGREDLFVYDLQHFSVERVNVSSNGDQAVGSSPEVSDRPTMSADGRYVAFQSNATNLVPGDINASSDIFVFDRQSRGIERVSVRSDGTQFFGPSFGGAISGNGQYIAFEDGGHRLYVFDRNMHQLELETPTVGAIPSISSDGRFVEFSSGASNLVPGDSNGFVDVFIYDRQNQTTVRINVSDAQGQANLPSFNSTISADGRFVAFDSIASNLVDGDTNASYDVFVSPNRSAVGADSRSIGLFAGQLYTGADFGLVPGPGTIQGRCFNDVVANGALDNGEPGRPGCTIYLDLNKNGRFDAADISTTTASDGSYSFTTLDSEQEYQVGLASVPSDQTIVLPAPTDNGIYKVYLPAGQTITDRDFGLRPASTTGQSDASIVQGTISVSTTAPTQPCVPQMTVYLDLNDNDIRDADEPRKNTACDGSYSFTGLGGRDYSVKVVPDQHFLEKTPIGNQLTPLPTLLTQTNSSPKDVVVGDFNGDSFPDLAMAIQDHGAVSILLNDQKGGFLPPLEISLHPANRPVTQPHGDGAFALLAGKFNDTGGDDLAVVNAFTSNVAILLDFNGSGFGSENYITVGSTPDSIARDPGTGKVQYLYVTNDIDNFAGNTNNVTILQNSGTGAFSIMSQLAAGNFPQSVVPGYFNNDQLLDFVVADYGVHQTGAKVADPGDVRVFIKQSDGTYRSSVACSVGFGPDAVVAVDFNGDQKADLAVTNFLTNDITICQGNGDGTFTRVAQPSGGPGPFDLAAADIDNDGDPDLLVTDVTGKGAIGILRNNSTAGSIAFDPIASTAAGLIPDQAALTVTTGHFHGDQNPPDIVVADSARQSVTIQQNKLTGGPQRLTLTGINTVSGADFAFQQMDLPPTLSPITNPSAANEDSPPIVVSLTGINAGAGETQPLRVSVDWDNKALIASAVSQYQSPATTGSVVLTLKPDQSGESNVIVTVTDGGLDGDLNTPGDNASVSQTFSVTVNPVNDPPTFDPLDAIIAINRNATTQTINLTGITAGGGESQPLRVTATTPTNAWIQNLQVQYSGGATASVTYTTTNTNSSGQISITLTDGGLDNNLNTPGDNLSITQTIGIVSTNNPPTVALANVVTALPENTGTATHIKLADIVVSDDGVGGQLLSLSGADSRYFELVGNALFLAAGVVLDYETKSQFTAIVAVDDPTVGNSPDATTTLALNLTDVNEPPTISLSGQTKSLPENTDIGVHLKVADIVIHDDALGVNTIRLVGADASRFEIIGQALYLAAGQTLNFEAQNQLQVTLIADDAAVDGSVGASVDYALAITDVNEVPTGLFLTDIRITPTADTVSGPVLVGAFVVIDEDRSSSGYAYSLLAGDGDSDNSSFQIDGNSLSLKQGTSVRPAGSSYFIRARVTDGPFVFDKQFEIVVAGAIPINHAPSFQKGNDILDATDEDSSVSVPGWATSISPGNADSQLQVVHFIVTSDNASLFTVQPAVDVTGKVTFAPKANQVGLAHVSVIAKDDGGTASGGIDQSDPQTFVIQVKKALVWHNEVLPQDVTGPNGFADGVVAADDVLAIINYINSGKPFQIAEDGRGGGPYYDVNGNKSIAADDVITVINYINAHPSMQGEGEAPARPAVPSATMPDYVSSDLLNLLAADVATSPKRRL